MNNASIPPQTATRRPSSKAPCFRICSNGKKNSSGGQRRVFRVFELHSRSAFFLDDPTPAQTHYAAMGCGSWTTEAAKRNRLRDGITNSALSYDIRVEVGLSIGTPTLVLLIKDEATSYLAGSKLKGLVDPEAAARNCRGREDFIMQFRKECEVTDIQISNQAPWIGRAEYSYFSKTAAEVTAWLESTIEGVARAVGLAMYEIDEWTRLLAECDVESEEPFLLTATAAITVGSGSDRRSAVEELPFPVASETNPLTSLQSEKGISRDERRKTKVASAGRREDSRRIAFETFDCILGRATDFFSRIFGLYEHQLTEEPAQCVWNWSRLLTANS